MLERIKSLLANWADGAESSDQTRQRVELSAAVLMVEAATMDAEMQPEERDRIVSLLRDRFALGEEPARALLAEAERAQAESAELFRFTRSLKDALDDGQRVEIIEMLWQIVYTDGQLHDYEANLVRRVSGLLFISDQESGAARKRALARLGLSGD